MALPVILIDSAVGSDSAASGAGPATALTGSSASTSGDGLTVTLDGSPDLSGVATDGSHVIFLNDTTANARNFAKITGKDDGAKTVTVASAFGLSLSGKGWAIGGKRATISAASSRRLLERAFGAADAEAGWVIEFQSGSTDSWAGVDLFTWFAAGDTTNGPVTLRGADGAATMPILTFTNNGDGLRVRAAHTVIKHLEFRNTNATKTASQAINGFGLNSMRVEGCVITHATNKFAIGIRAAQPGAVIIGNHIANCASHGIYTPGDSAPTWIVDNDIHDNGGRGIYWDTNGGNGSKVIIGNLITGNASHGIEYTANSSITRGCVTIIGNTIDDNAGDGVRFAGTAADLVGLTALNNILTNNGGYGMHFVSLGAAGVEAYNILRRSNNTYNNTSGASNPAGILTDDPGLDPQFTNPGARDYSIGTNLKAKGFPIGGTRPIGTFSATHSYVDIGAAQREEPAGGGGLIRHPGTMGGFNG